MEESEYDKKPKMSYVNFVIDMFNFTSNSEVEFIVFFLQSTTLLATKLYGPCRIVVLAVEQGEQES